MEEGLQFLGRKVIRNDKPGTEITGKRSRKKKRPYYYKKK